MGVRRGTATPSKVYRGTVPVKKIMRGTVEVWSASPYPLNGTWGPVTLTNGQEATVVSHTIAESGSYTISASEAPESWLDLYVNGTVVAYTTGGGQPLSHTMSITAGGTVVVKRTAAANRTFSGTWSIVKN